VNTAGSQLPVDEFQELAFEIFKVNGSLIRGGDRLVESLGLTSARWQILGAIMQSPRPQPVSWIAREIGGRRQNVQRIVNDFERDGLVTFETNPHHRRAHLIVVTELGSQTFRQAMELSAPWSAHAVQGVSADDIAAALRMLQTIRANIESYTPANEANAISSTT